MQPVRTMGVKAASRARRSLLGLLMKLPGGSGDASDLIRHLPESALLPLRRRDVDPVPELADLREHDPVSRMKMPLGLRGWLVTGHDECREVLAAPADTFSNDFGNMINKIGIAAEDDPGGLGFADPPHHTRLRKMLTPHFTARAVAAQAPRVREIVADAITAVAAAGAGGAVVDLQRHFALQIPSRVIMELLGVDEHVRPEFHRLSTERFVVAEGVGSSLEAMQQSIELLRDVVAAQRRTPGPGLIGAILAEFGEDIGDVELAGLADGVLVGGLETTVSMLTLGALVLLQDRAAWDALLAGDEHVDACVEELLRHLTVVGVGFPRFAVQDVTVAGRRMFAGDIVVSSLAAANRDARLGTGMERFDHTRAATPHLAFGHGLHRCVGAELARLELRIAYPALVRAFPELRLAAEPAELRFRELSIVHGLEELPVRVR